MKKVPVNLGTVFFMSPFPLRVHCEEKGKRRGKKRKNKCLSCHLKQLANFNSQAGTLEIGSPQVVNAQVRTAVQHAGNSLH